MRCLVKSSNERNPCCQLPARKGGDSGETAQINWEEGGDDVRSVWPLCPGLHTYYNAQYRGGRSREAEEILKTGPSSDCRLQPAYTKPESLVMAHQLRRRGIRSRVLYTPPVTSWKPVAPEVSEANRKEAGS